LNMATKVPHPPSGKTSTTRSISPRLGRVDVSKIRSMCSVLNVNSSLLSQNMRDAMWLPCAHSAACMSRHNTHSWQAHRSRHPQCKAEPAWCQASSYCKGGSHYVCQYRLIVKAELCTFCLHVAPSREPAREREYGATPKVPRPRTGGDSADAHPQRVAHCRTQPSTPGW
jgi:hypothetical protein